MAEGILFEIAGKLLGNLSSSAYKQLGLAWGAKSEIGKLKTTVSLIKAMVRDVEEQQRNNNHEVTHWLNELRDVLYDVDDLLDDLNCDALRRKIMSGNKIMKEVRTFFSKSNKFAYSHKVGRRVKSIRERLDAVADDRAKFHFTDRPLELSLVVRERDQTHSFVRAQDIIGRDDDKMKIVQLLLQSDPETDVSIVPIVGIGGLGKTTLAKMVFNDENLGDRFDQKMWVCVSEKFELRVIVENIIEAVTGIRPDSDLQMETLQNRLRGKIREKRYFLVLDDVWNEDLDRWLSLKTLLLDCKMGSWIVITTRSEGVARITGTISAHVLRGLSRDESWSLLKRMACKEESSGDNDSRFKAIGMEIVDKCGGVPLALRAIGRVLYKREEAEWLKVKNNVHGYITRPESDIMPILKLSYDHLPSHLKQCFAYCSLLIPKDTEFKVKKLIRYWMAQGFIPQPLSSDDDLRDTGLEYFMDLLWKSFFQVAKDFDSRNVKRFTMHDLMHDLACSVAGAEYCIYDSQGDNVNATSRHISFVDCLHPSWENPNTMLKGNRVRSFILLTAGFTYLSSSICNLLVSNLKYLRMLDLSFSNIERLPHSIGELKHLRDLDLSGNGSIRKLPSSMCKLQHLQTLDLYNCRSLEKLPSKTSRLVSLKHLDILGCDELGYMPRGLGKLTSLRTLSRFVVGKRGREVGGLRELNGLNKLAGSLHILHLQNAGIPEPGSTYLKQKPNLKSLDLKWIRGKDDVIDIVKDERVLECLEPHPNLEDLQVSWYQGRKISSWLSSITNLTQLRLEHCSNCKHLPRMHHLSSLKVVKLSSLQALECMSELELEKELLTIFFPSLEKLWIEDCRNLKGWWRSGDVSKTSNAQMPSFPCLSNLDIRGCPNLTSMPPFPYIKELYLEETSWKSTTSSSSSSIFSPFSKLETLSLNYIQDVDSLPEEFLQKLTSLYSLDINGCINLTSMPEGMRHLNSLEHLHITTGSQQLKERCQRDTGVDWPNIAHIPHVQIC